METNRFDLCNYRIEKSEGRLKSAKINLDNGLYVDSINRSYYAVFLAIRAILAIESVDYKKHKDVIAHFNQYYVASEIFPKQFGRKINEIQSIRHKSDYDDFYMGSKEEAEEQYAFAVELLQSIKEYVQSLYPEEREDV